MTLASLLAYVGVAALVICTPGPDTALTIRNTLFGGRAGGVLTALGVATGLSVWRWRLASASSRCWWRASRSSARSSMPAPPI